MVIDILTLFPGMVMGAFSESMIKRAQEKGLVAINIIDLREYTDDKHRTADDKPFGGGAGMVMKPEPIFKAIESLRGDTAKVIFLTPQGTLMTQEKARELAQETHLIFLCGHYEGVDERVREHLVDEEISIGDYVLTNGAIAAIVVVDATVRMISGVLGDPDSARYDSFSEGLLDYPQYTRPYEFRTMKVPDELVSGDHERIEKWRRHKALERTWKRRPDLIDKRHLTKEERQWLQEV